MDDSRLPHRTLGLSGIEVSVLSLGSWRTFDRIGAEDGLAVLMQARASGINFLDIARYNDETGEAPVPTGYSELVFGEIWRRLACPREQFTIAEKLWWEFWPGESAVQEIDSSLQRTGLEYVDLLYSDPPPEALPMEKVVATMGELIAAGKTRAWGVVNWPAERLAEAGQIAQRQGVPSPCAAQLPYNLVQREWVEGPAMADALALCGASVVASYVLLGGVLTGKYARGEQGRMTAGLGGSMAELGKKVVEPLADLASDLGVPQSSLAVAFALGNPIVATVLSGATRPEQIVQNVRAADLAGTLTEARFAELRAIVG
jgi:aryl-alcohol dehydrogenase-like predicted oxidoreductase